MPPALDHEVPALPGGHFRAATRPRTPAAQHDPGKLAHATVGTPNVMHVLRFILAAVVAVAMAAIGAAFAWPITDLIARHDVGHLTGTLRAVHLETARDAARGRLLQLGAGLFAAAALVFTARNFTLSRRNIELTEQGQVTDRYAKAIEQLGSEKQLDVRIGAIYALERIAHDSAKDHPTVMEVLAAFVREHSREQWPTPGAARPGAPSRSTRPDVQAAITVMGRRISAHDLRVIDLDSADLTFANLNNANLARASLGNVNLYSANLGGADLTRAFLMSADLTGAMLRDAKLTKAFLNFATLDAGVLAADLEGADLRYAQYPLDAEVPKGWVRAPDGKLSRAPADNPAGEDNR